MGGEISKSDDVIGETLFIVRLYDGFDNLWIDVTTPLPYAEAKAEWDKRTDGGTKMVNYSFIDYYRIFPADTTMVFSGGFWER